jgi:hypothetical protein
MSASLVTIGVGGVVGDSPKVGVGVGRLVGDGPSVEVGLGEGVEDGFEVRVKPGVAVDLRYTLETPVGVSRPIWPQASKNEAMAVRLPKVAALRKKSRRLMRCLGVGSFISFSPCSLIELGHPKGHPARKHRAS